MGVLYGVIPLIEVTSKRGGRELLAEFRVPYSMPEKGRYPSLKEVKETIHATQGVSIDAEYIGSEEWQLSLEGIGDEHTLLWCTEYDGDELVPHPISFEKGWPEVIVRTMEALSRVCGDFVIFADCGAMIVVSPGTDSNAEWYDGEPHTENDNESIML